MPRTRIDWFDIKYRELEGVPAPPSVFGPFADVLQNNVHFYLDGKPTSNGVYERRERTVFSKIGRFFFFYLIIGNVIAVVMESIPEVDKYVGNEPGNFFDVFEDVSIVFFTLGTSIS